MRVVEFESPEFSYCPNCDPGGVGCKIYETRPEVCRVTNCLWMNQDVVPADLRPDRCGVMFEIPPFSLVYVGYVDPKRPDAWKDPAPQLLIQKIKDAGNSVVILSKDKKKTYFSLTAGDTIERVRADLRNCVAKNLERGVI